MSTDPRTVADVELIANAYHWAAGNSCSPDNCPGVPECIYAEHLSWDGFVAILAALDLDARDARVRAEALRWAAAVMPAYDRSPVAVRARLTALAEELERVASSPVDAPSRPTGTPTIPAHWTGRRGEGCTGHPSTDGERE